ncbi:hypothetical protein Y032_0642g1037 [Ancylostoma ceylanicum]|uniref:Uncharacterized protein n=1 Tax=Ancylostoma ceylanicum TaxID=53326 RepID=A0A016WJC1_9BILA|nr:hypothetical protein Y032_0642g1037 [Ancylostoma ceylanicum]
MGDNCTQRNSLSDFHVSIRLDIIPHQIVVVYGDPMTIGVLWKSTSLRTMRERSALLFFNELFFGKANLQNHSYQKVCFSLGKRLAAVYLRWTQISSSVISKTLRFDNNPGNDPGND